MSVGDEESQPPSGTNVPERWQNKKPAERSLWPKTPDGGWERFSSKYAVVDSISYAVPHCDSFCSVYLMV